MFRLGNCLENFPKNLKVSAISRDSADKVYMKNRVNILVIGLAAAVLVGCAPSTPASEPPKTPGVTFLPPSIGPTDQPPIDPDNPGDPGFTEPNPAPTPTLGGNAAPIPYPSDGTQTVDGMFVAISPEDVDVSGVQISGFTSRELQEGAAWAAALTKARFDSSGYWADGDQKTDPYSPTTYYGFVSFLAENTRKKVEPWLLDSAAIKNNFTALSELLPLPPEVPGEWMLPAVANYAFAQPTFSPSNAGARAVNITIPYAAYAVSGDKLNRTYYAVEIKDTATYTLVGTKDGWRLAAWASNPQYGAPQQSKKAPTDRYFVMRPE